LTSSKTHDAVARAPGNWRETRVTAQRALAVKLSMSKKKIGNQEKTKTFATVKDLVFLVVDVVFGCVFLLCVRVCEFSCKKCTNPTVV